MKAIPEEIILSQFLLTMRGTGITPKEDFYPICDGQLHRFAVDGDKHGAKSGAYFIHSDQWPNWGVMDYRKHDCMQKFKFSTDCLNDYQLQEFREQFKNNNYQQEQDRQRAEKLKRQKEREQRAIITAHEEYTYPNAKGLFTTHPYLEAKHISNVHSIRGANDIRIKTQKLQGHSCNEGYLLIPLVDAQNGEFKSLQWISSTPNQDGKFQRGFYPGLEMKGCCAELIPFVCRNTPPNGILEADTIYIVEGIATGLSLLEIFDNKIPVFAAMSAGNILNITRALRTRYSGIRYKHLKIIIAADHDEAGINAADKTIQAGYADTKVIPPVQGMDWNDFLNSKKGY